MASRGPRHSLAGTTISPRSSINSCTAASCRGLASFLPFRLLPPKPRDRVQSLPSLGNLELRPHSNVEEPRGWCGCGGRGHSNRRFVTWVSARPLRGEHLLQVTKRALPCPTATHENLPFLSRVCQVTAARKKGVLDEASHVRSMPQLPGRFGRHHGRSQPGPSLPQPFDT